jgi:hypothetical protein
MVHMRLFNVRNLLVAALLAGALAAPGCYAEMQYPDTVYVGNYGYEPMYYNGYVVYYDGVGRPFYYVGGRQVWIAPSSPYYAGYVAHYRTYGPAYHNWYRGGGARYTTYRGPGGYYGGHRGYVQRYNRAPAPRPAPRR